MSRKTLLILVAAGVAALIVIGNFTSRAPAQQRPATVEIIVTGSPADVTYGPSGSSLPGSVPMDVTLTVSKPPPAFYAVNAQLQGGGSVSCEIRVDGTVVSAGQASGGYRIATCEISPGVSGGWESDT